MTPYQIGLCAVLGAGALFTARYFPKTALFIVLAAGLSLAVLR